MKRLASAVVLQVFVAEVGVVEDRLWGRILDHGPVWLPVVIDLENSQQGGRWARLEK